MKDVQIVAERHCLCLSHMHDLYLSINVDNRLPTGYFGMAPLAPKAAASHEMCFDASGKPI